MLSASCPLALPRVDQVTPAPAALEGGAASGGWSLLAPWQVRRPCAVVGTRQVRPNQCSADSVRRRGGAAVDLGPAGSRGGLRRGRARWDLCAPRAHRGAGRATGSGRDGRDSGPGIEQGAGEGRAAGCGRPGHTPALRFLLRVRRAAHRWLQGWKIPHCPPGLWAEDLELRSEESAAKLGSPHQSRDVWESSRVAALSCDF